jgi:hypothetical protein
MVGKICQSLSGTLTEKHDLGDGKTLEMSDLVVGGGKFIKSDDNDEHKNLTYLYNPTSFAMSVCISDIGDGTAADYIVKPLEKLPIDDFLMENVGPDNEIMIGPVGDSVTNNTLKVNDDTEVKVKVKNFRLGDLIDVGEFKLKLTSKGLIIMGTTAIVCITYFFVSTNKKVGHTVNGNITVNPNNTNPTENIGDSVKEYQADIDFNEIGIAEEDLIEDLTIFLKVNSESLSATKRCSKSVPLTEAEKAILNA